MDDTSVECFKIEICCSNDTATMEKGDILGHENMGEVVERVSEINILTVGDKVVTPFVSACGKCEFCIKKMWSLCDKSNPNAPRRSPADLNEGILLTQSMTFSD